MRLGHATTLFLVASVVVVKAGIRAGRRRRRSSSGTDWPGTSLRGDAPARFRHLVARDISVAECVTILYSPEEILVSVQEASGC